MFPNTASYQAALANPPRVLAEKTARYGWGSSHPWFEFLIQETRPDTVIEVGSWLGASAVHMAQVCAKHHLRTRIICVDTWLGSPALYRDPIFVDALAFRDGYPTLFHGFLASVVESGQGERIMPLPLPSTLAAEVLASSGVKAELIYIDADHSFAGCLADLRAYSPLLTDAGVILGDDFGSAGVSGAVAAFLAESAAGWHLYAHAGKFLLSQRQLDGLKDHHTHLQPSISERQQAFSIMPSLHATEQIANVSLLRILSLKLRGRWPRFVRSAMAGLR